MPALAIHGLRTGRLAEYRHTGPQRPSSAYFLLDDLPLPDVAWPDEDGLHVTLTLALFHAVSMSTLADWSREPPAHWRDWYRNRPDRLPALLLADLPSGWPAATATVRRRYASALVGAYGRSAGYVKTADVGPVPGPITRPPFLVRLDDVAAAEAAVRRRLAAVPGAALVDAGFYRKAIGPERLAPPVPAWGGCGAVRCVPEPRRHPDAVLAAPLLAAELAMRVRPRVLDGAGW